MANKTFNICGNKSFMKWIRAIAGRDWSNYKSPTGYKPKVYYPLRF